MGRLPPYHVRRPRLTSPCLGASAVVVEAAAGYGKTVLGMELADAWRSVAIEVLLHEGGVSAQLFAARLRAAAANAGFSQAAATMAEPSPSKRRISRRRSTGFSIGWARASPP